MAHPSHIAKGELRGLNPASRDPFLHPRVMLNRDSRANASMFPFVSLRFDRALARAQAAVTQP